MRLDEALTVYEPLNEWRLPALTKSISRELDKFTPRELANKVKALMGRSSMPADLLAPASDEEIEQFKETISHPKMQEVLAKHPDIKQALQKIADSAGLEQLPAVSEPSPVTANIDTKTKKLMFDIKREVEDFKAKPRGEIEKLVDSYLRDPKKKRAYQLAIKTGLIKPPKL